MPQENKLIYHFCDQNWNEVRTALESFQQAKDTLIQSDETGFNERLYKYFEQIYNLARMGEKSVLWDCSRNLIKNLEIKRIKSFIVDFKNEDNKENLANQLTLVYAGLGFFLPIDVYEPGEIEKIALNNFGFFDDRVFAYTLGKILLDGTSMPNYLEPLQNMLQSNGGKEMQVQLTWEDNFLFVLLLNVLWRYFYALSPNFQELLVKNYFYLSLVAGVPLRKIIARVIKTGTAPEQAQKEKFFYELLENNIENIPTNVACTEWKKMIDAVKNYSVRLQGRQSSGFDQEEFVKGFYEGQEGRDAFRGWLRELINIMFHLYE